MRSCLVEFDSSCRLVRADSSRFDLGPVVVLAFDWPTSNAAQQVDLSDVRERIGDWTLKQTLGGRVERLI